MSEIRYKGQIYSGAAAFGGADDVSYDNTASGLSSTTVQDALDEIADGGGSTGCVELTQAQYDALTEEEQMADVIYLITDSPDNYLDEVFGDFASVEYTSTASKAYSVGDYIVYDGKFYKVTTAITQGGTITVGTNVTQTTVGDEVKRIFNLKDFPTAADTISNANLNNKYFPGVYLLAGGIEECPYGGGYGYLVVYSSDPQNGVPQNVRQIFYPVGTDVVFERRKYQGTWNAWVPITDIVTQTFDMPAFEVAAGTPGTFITMLTCDVTKTGYTPIACSFALIGHPGTYLAIATISGNTVTAHVFRASAWSGTYSKGDIKVAVVYRRST